MKILTTTACMAACVALAVSCSSDEPSINSEAGNAPAQFKVNIADGTDTRLSYEDKGTDGVKLTWEADDEFKLFGVDGSNNITGSALYSTSGSGATATFTLKSGETAPTGTVFIPLHPATAVLTDVANKTVNLAMTEQSQVKTNPMAHLENYDLMTTTGTTFTGANNNFTFTHKGTMFMFDFTALPSDIGTPTTMEISTKDAADQDISLFYENYNSTSSPTTNKLALTLIGYDAAETALKAYMMIIPRKSAYPDGTKLTVKLIGSQKTYKFTGEIGSKEYEAAKRYTFGIVGSSMTETDIWATGNLVAKADGSGCEIGTATDKGLFFQFGSLVGWSKEGSATIAIKPAAFNGKEDWAETGKIWQGTTGTVPFTATGSDNEKAGVGDPCRYYLGDTWRLPTKDEYVALFKKHGYPSTGPWKWDDTSKSATNSTKNLTFQASGYRSFVDGGLNFVDVFGYLWSATPSTVSEGGYLLFTNSGLNPGVKINRANGLPVRCIRESN